MTNQIHIAAQYLATAGKSFLVEKEDDSHTNLGFNSEKGFLETWPLSSKKHKLAFDNLQFSLHWLERETISSTLLLKGKTHKEVIDWISEVTGIIENRPYAYQLHYDLPYDEITQDFIFNKPKPEELDHLLNLRKLAQGAMEKVVKNMGLDTKIRIWPHHFDTGGFATLDERNNINIGFGMAIPDPLVEEFYFYTSGYEGHTAIATNGFDSLVIGKWHNEDFKGAILPATGIDETIAYNFFIQSISAFKK